jgi:hypothetical protein
VSNSPGIVTGIIPSGVSADVGTLYLSLLPFEWEGVGIPYTEMKLTLRQDLVIHKFVDRDGAYVEGTGRAPLQFEATVPFINTIAAASSETWKQPLYPTNWRAFMQACQEGETGILQHPELGAITCKVEQVVTTWRGTERGGPTVHVTWIETDDSTINGQLESALGQPSPISAANAACATLDSNLGAINQAVFPSPPVFTTSFSALMGQIAGLAEQAQLLSYQFGGQLNAIVYQCNTLENDLNATPSALNWPLFQSAEQAKDACYTLQGNLLTTGANISTYTTPADATIPNIATQLGTNLSLFLNLNPTLALNPVVPAGTVVRFYAQAA